MKRPHRLALKRIGQAHEPVAVRALDRLVEHLDQPLVVRIGHVAVEHERHAKPLGRRVEDQLAGVEMADSRWFQVGHPDLLAPMLEAGWHVAVEQHLHPLEVARLADRVGPFLQRSRPDRHHPPALEQPRIVTIVDAVGQGDDRVDILLGQSRQPVGPGVDVDLQRRVKRAQ